MSELYLLGTGFYYMCRWFSLCMLYVVLFLVSDNIHAWQQAQVISQDGSNPFVRSTGMAISPDGSRLYVVGTTSDRLKVFAVQGGTLECIGMFPDSEHSAGSLDSANDVAVSRDGKRVFVASSSDGTLTSFGMHQNNGTLYLNQVFRNGISGVEGLNCPGGIAVTTDNRQVFVTSACEREESTGNTLSSFNYNATTGQLGFDRAYSGFDLVPAVVSPDGFQLYSLHEGNLNVYSRMPVTGELSFIQTLSAANDITGGIAASPDGQQVFSLDAKCGLLVFDRNKVTGQLALGQIVREVAGRNCMDHIEVTADGKQILVAGINDSSISVFNRFPVNGTVIFSQQFRDGQDSVDGLSHPVNIVATPNNSHFFVSGYGDDAIAVFDRSAATGEVRFDHVVRNAGIRGGGFSTNIAVASDNRQFFVSNQRKNTLKHFRHNADNRVECLSVFTEGNDGVKGLNGANGIAITPDQLQVLVTSLYDNSLVLFDFDHEKNKLSYNRTITGQLDDPGDIIVSPDGKNIYIISDSGLLAFDRNPDSGIITFDRRYHNELRGVLEDVVISPDGQQLYASTSVGDLNMFERLNDGTLYHLQTFPPSVRYPFAKGLAVSPDSRQVFTTFTKDGFLSVFNRNDETGILDWQFETALDEMNNPRHLMVSPDGTEVVVTGSNDRELTLFRRFPVSGTLRFAQTLTQDVRNTTGTRETRAAVSSPDGSLLFVVGEIYKDSDTSDLFDTSDPIGSCDSTLTILEKKPYCSKDASPLLAYSLQTLESHGSESQLVNANGEILETIRFALHPTDQAGDWMLRSSVNYLGKAYDTSSVLFLPNCGGSEFGMAEIQWDFPDWSPYPKRYQLILVPKNNCYGNNECQSAIEIVARSYSVSEGTGGDATVKAEDYFIFQAAKNGQGDITPMSSVQGCIDIIAQLGNQLVGTATSKSDSDLDDKETFVAVNNLDITCLRDDANGFRLIADGHLPVTQNLTRVPHGHTGVRAMLTSRPHSRSTTLVWYGMGVDLNGADNSSDDTLDTTAAPVISLVLEQEFLP